MLTLSHDPLKMKEFFQKALLSITNFRDLSANKYFQSLVLSPLLFIFTKLNFRKAVDEGYGKNVDVYSITSQISRVAAAIPIKLFDVKADGTKEEVKDSELNALLVCPNRLQLWSEYVEEALTYLLLTGNTYTAGTEAIGMGEGVWRELTPLPAHITRPITGDAINPISGYLVDFDQTTRYSFEEVMHIKYFNPTADREQMLVGMSPLQAGSQNLDASNLLQTAEASILVNKGASGIITSGSDMALRGKDKEKLQNEWSNDADGASKMGKIIAHTGDLKFIQLGMSPTDLKILESSVLKLRNFCNIYGVSSQLFNDPANKTFNNLKEAEKAFITKAVIPLYKRFIEGLNVWLLPAWSKRENKNFTLEIDTSDIEVLQEDKDKRAQRSERKSKEVREIQKNVALGQTSPEGARSALVLIHNFTQEEAERLIIEPTPAT